MESPNDVRAVVADYFAHMERGDVAVASLFHDDAQLIGLGRVVSGRAAIEAFYAASIFDVEGAKIRSLTYFVADHPS